MPKIWTEQGQVKETPNRNNFDLSRQNHLTLKPGGLYPIMCEPVVPGDSFDIKCAIGLKFMPLVFPVQSKMRAHVYFFGIRNKNIWPNWMNFAQQLEEHVHPYIEQPSSFFETGSLADYLNVPTTQVGYPLGLVHQHSDVIDWFDDFRLRRGGTVHVFDPSNVTVPSDGDVTTITLSAMYGVPILMWPDGYQWNDIVTNAEPASSQTVATMFFFNQALKEDPDPNHPFIFVGLNLNSSSMDDLGTVTLALWLNRPGADFATEGTLNYNQPGFLCSGRFDFLDSHGSTSVAQGRYGFSPSSGNTYSAFCETIANYRAQGYDAYLSVIVSRNVTPLVASPGVYDKDEDRLLSVSLFNEFYYTARIPKVTDNVVKPFGSEVTNNQRIRLNALPFRAYESVYNAFFRNTQNQPFYINGVEQFNRYNTTLEDGADTTPYHIFFRNYEMDYLTSALQSPQQGVAPLVGLTDTGTITIADENGITTGTYEVDQDGTIGQVVVTSPNASVEHGRIAMSLATAGFSINDFRGTNALTRWLEMNLRRGYKYMDFITGHFGQTPHYDSLDMPEFLGGFSETVQVNMISSTADTSGSGGLALGEYAGQANCFGINNHPIRHYCDDFGYILGILCVVPSPAYTQLLPKDFLRSQPLDYPFPEFAHLGLQPITYREVCPIQSYSEYVETEGASGNNQDTFGYQRPNYDMVGHVDEVHGQFRSTMKNYLVNRIFAERPQLGDEFLQINPEEINDIFLVTDPREDTIIGQVVLDVKAKRPFPRVVVPNLGK